MVSASSLLLVALGILTNASPLMPRVDCQKGVYIISARGTIDYSYNVPGTFTWEGRTGEVAQMIEGKIKGSRRVAVEYQATFDYDPSLLEGVKDAKKKIIEYVDTCGKDSRIVLLGFSQGGNVMSDVLAGGVKNGEPALPDKYKSSIVGVAVFGDPSFTKNQPFNGGNSTKSGVFDRSKNATSLARLKTFSSIFRSYCDEGDEFCSTDSSKIGDRNDVHGNEVPTHADDATKFIVGRYNKLT